MNQKVRENLVKEVTAVLMEHPAWCSVKYDVAHNYVQAQMRAVFVTFKGNKNVPRVP